MIDVKTNCRKLLTPSAFLLVAVAACIVTPAASVAQTAYFSITGEFSTAGDELDFGFNLSRSVISGEALGFSTYASSGGINEAGDTIADGPGDSELMLFNAGGTLIAEDDDDGAFSRDSLITFTEGDTPLPSPLTAQSYRLNLSDFDDDADPLSDAAN